MQKRKTLGICFNCDEVYRPGHFCKKQQLYLMVATLAEAETSEPDEAVTDVDDPPAVESDMEISLNALTGNAIGDTIRIPGFINNHAVSILIDTSSTHSFIDCDLAYSLGCCITPTANLSVTVANGEKTTSTGICNSLHWKMHNHSFIGNLRLFALGGCDIVLGADWLRGLGDITFNLANLSVSFLYKGQQVTLVGAPSPPALRKIGPKGVKEFFKNNFHGIFAHLYSVTPNPPSTPLPPIISGILQDFQDIFSEPTKLPPHRSLDHFIPLQPNSTPINQRPYKCPYVQKSVIEQLVQEMLHSGVIQPSHSPFASPILLVKKKDNSWRFSVDYRKLNNITIKDKFPILVIDELLDELQGSYVFTRVDLRAGYHQIRVTMQDIYKTTFRTHQGHYEFTGMPFGLTNAPATFQALINDIFKPYLRKFILVFFDDILVYSPDIETHAKHLQITLSLLRQHQLFTKLSK
ncbi:uncharacterized protein LOC113324872 [Papaver somniferum]|uniref:uncharacterized protein LOC113324872 n=1 Tax=Papaver somniferum TaxID=3469 RepID=UPI000E702284|nr:uncharacterized protein LOC113324872 [Papaver somniferum]